VTVGEDRSLFIPLVRAKEESPCPSDANVAKTEHQHLRCLRDRFKKRIQRADKVLEELSIEFGSCYLRLAARRLLESAVDAASSGSLDISLRQQLQDALYDAKATGLEPDDDALVQQAELMLEESAATEAAEVLLQVQQAVAQEDLEQAVTNATRRLEEAADQEDIPSLVEAKSRLLEALSKARSLGLDALELKAGEQLRRRTHLAIQDLRGVVRVFCRVRPLNTKELAKGDAPVVHIPDGQTVEIPEVGTVSKGERFSFDGVFSPGQDLFEDCRDLIQGAVDGHNVTIFSYGQTGAGKTFTMTGTPEDPQEGLTFKSVDELFRILDRLPSDIQVEASASMCELYNDRVVDLLRPPVARPMGSRRPSNLMDDVVECKVQDRQELRSLLVKGLQRRATCGHSVNSVSSRSHMIFTLGVCTTDSVTGEAVKGKVVLCDLAGSERLKKSESEGAAKEEAIHINKSLAALGNVIEAAAAKKKVPYREHKLTQLLQDSIGGTAKTLMIVNCTPAASSLHETIMTLRYGIRAKRVINNHAGRAPGSASRFGSKESPGSVRCPGSKESSSGSARCPGSKESTHRSC
jgi:hypothetical protein